MKAEKWNKLFLNLKDKDEAMIKLMSSKIDCYKEYPELFKDSLDLGMFVLLCFFNTFELLF